MLDANFRLKLKQRNLVDPPLGGALAYFVDQDPYMSHVKSAGTQVEVRVVLIADVRAYILGGQRV